MDSLFFDKTTRKWHFSLPGKYAGYIVTFFITINPDKTKKLEIKRGDITLCYYENISDSALYYYVEDKKEYKKMIRLIENHEEERKKEIKIKNAQILGKIETEIYAISFEFESSNDFFLIFVKKKNGKVVLCEDYGIKQTTLSLENLKKHPLILNGAKWYEKVTHLFLTHQNFLYDTFEKIINEPSIRLRLLLKS